MSDFDKEAEREKLRRQFEAEKREREATERMSDLLLQGATMTNRHCERCHSPVFRYEGQAFCPTCQRTVEADAESASNADADAGNADPDTKEGSPRQPDAGSDRALEPDADPTSAARIEIDDPSDATDSESPTDREPGSTAEADDRSSPTPTDSPERSDPTPAPGVGATGRVDEHSTPGEGEGSDADLAEAQQSLSHTLVRLARTAERSDDLGRTRDCLAGAREAADAIAALKRARR